MRPRQHSLSLKSFCMWFKLRTLRRKAHQNKLSWASLPPPPDSWKAPSGGRAVACRGLACCCVKAAGKLNKQQCLFITKRRGDKETRWEHYLQVLYESRLLLVHTKTSNSGASSDERMQVSSTKTTHNHIWVNYISESSARRTLGDKQGLLNRLKKKKAHEVLIWPPDSNIFPTKRSLLWFRL